MKPKILQRQTSDTHLKEYPKKFPFYKNHRDIFPKINYQKTNQPPPFEGKKKKKTLSEPSHTWTLASLHVSIKSIENIDLLHPVNFIQKISKFVDRKMIDQMLQKINRQIGK